MRFFFPVGGRALLVTPVAVFLVAKSLAAFAALVGPYLTIHYDAWFELGMVVGQVLFQWCFLWKRPWQDKLDYAYLLVLVSSLGAALLLPLFAWHHLAPVTALAATAYFLGVVGTMFAVHWAAVKARGLPRHLCFTWVLYRLLILAVVLRRP